MDLETTDGLIYLLVCLQITATQKKMSALYTTQLFERKGQNDKDKGDSKHRRYSRRD